VAVIEPRERILRSLDEGIDRAEESEQAATSEPQGDGSQTGTTVTTTWSRHAGTRATEPGTMLRRYQQLALIGDAASALVAAAVALAVRFGAAPSTHYVLLSLLIPPGWLAVIAAQRGYERRFLGTGPDEYRKVVGAGLLLFTVIAVLAYALRSDVARGYVFIAVPLTVVLTVGVRHQLRDWIYRLRERGQALQRVLVVGRADAVVSLIEKLDHEPQHGLVPVGACVPYVGAEVSHVHDVPVLGDPSRVLQAVDETGAHVVAVVSHPDMSGHALRRLSWALEERDVELIVSPGIIEVAGPRISIRPIAGLSLLHLERPSASGGRMLGKAVFDRVVGGLMLLTLSPLFLAIAAAVRLTSAGPAFHRQTRVGIDGRQFRMVKFRSMVMDADARRAGLLEHSDGNGMLFKLRHDPRVTGVGAVLRRFSLDELPQLMNVMRGEMSLVGPRPPLPEEVAGYTDDATRRLKVKPGMTGLWQVSGRSDLTWEESLRLDLRYTDNWSLALDLSILWRTVRAVIRGSGAY
jgi:exopolysaccharide biosynthesis polyprenyl glycosylphosphotransferase